MYGKNPITKQQLREDGALAVHSVFPTIQGEGPDAGKPAVFVRLQGCSLRCHFCDTEFDTGELRTLDSLTYEVVKTAIANKIKLVVITGGDPIIQNFIPFTQACNGARLSVSIETAGTHWVPGITFYFHPGNHWGNLIICSPKTGQVNKDLIPYIGAWKYIVRAGEVSSHDGLPVFSTQSEGVNTPIFRPPADHPAPIYVQPMDEGEGNEKASKQNTELARDICLKHGYRLSLQIHKLVGVP